jgi:CRISPR/Cas system type I-B associated protein Csh2 (Cas7 group RAMP superfamily)
MANKGINILIELPTTFSEEDAEKIKTDLLDFFEKKNNYGANYGAKEGIKIKSILWSTNDR